MIHTIEDNAIKIAELLGHYQFADNLWTDKNTRFAFNAKQEFSSYNGLMPIVFECNSSYLPGFYLEIYHNRILLYEWGKLIHYIEYSTQLEFILAIQECCIKYLEVKND